MNTESLINLILFFATALVLGRRLRILYLRRKKKSAPIANLITLKRRAIQPSLTQPELLRSLIQAKSPEEHAQVLTDYPELKPFGEATQSVHDALNMLLMFDNLNGDSQPVPRVVAISEESPQISSVVTEAGNGTRIVNLFEIPADMLVQIVLVAEPEIQFAAIQSLQVALHHPQYLTPQSYWVFTEMLNAPQTKTEIKPKLERYHKALETCLQYGLDRDWIEQLQGH